MDMIRILDPGPKEADLAVGFFIGIRGSFIDEAQDSAEAFIQAINLELARLRLAPYDEPRELPNVYDGPLFGRSALDHDSARLLVELARRAMAAGSSPQLELLTFNPFRVAYVPRDVSPPVETGFRDQIGGEQYSIWCGSSERLLKEIIACAALFNIPVDDQGLEDVVASRINDYEPLSPGDDADAELADLRTTWPTLHEAARLSVGTGVALCLAG
jgi:hypothetical protein